MLRRSIVIRASTADNTGNAKRGLFTKLRDAFDPDKLRLAQAKTGRPTNVSMGDPVLNSHNLNAVIQPKRRNRQIDSQSDFFQSGETEKWMSVKDAAKFLGIPEDKLIGLKTADIELAWAKGYKDAKFGGKKNEASIAAEVLMEYVDSDLHTKKSRFYYQDKIEDMRKEVEHELGQSKEWYWEVVMQGFGGIVFAGSLIVVVMMYLSQIMSRENFSHMITNVQSFLNTSLLRPTNVEPPPDYINRYRDTPTALEIDQANGISFEDDDAQSAALHYDMKSTEDQENAFLVSLMNEENESAIMEAKQLIAEGTMWNIDHEKEGLTGEHGTATSQALQRLRDREASEPKERREKSAFEMSHQQFVSYFFTKMPSPARGRAAMMMERNKEQEETLSRVDANTKAAAEGAEPTA